VSKRNLEAAKSAYPFNSQAIINCQQDVEGYEEAMRRLEDLGRELFGIGIEKAEAQESTYDKINKSLGIPVGKKSKAKTEAGKARAARKGLVVPEQE
jgi:peroxiredoxin